MFYFPTRLSWPIPSGKVVVFVFAWLALQVRSGRAENGVSYKYADYRESGDRMVIESHYGLIDQDLGPTPRCRPSPAQPSVTLSGIISLVPSTESVTITIGGPGGSSHAAAVNASVGFANSREDDYVSNGWSLNTLTDFNQKNTTLLLGLAGTDDDIKVFYQNDWVKKRSTDLIAGVTQLLDPRTSVTFNLGYGRSTGYHADPYRVIQKRTEVSPGVFLPLTFGENRPAEREKWTALALINRSFPRANGSAEASYRFYHDTFGTTAHTLEIAWFQKLGTQFTLRPSFRFYDQTAADFYRIDITGTDITPTGRPVPAGPFFSADYRLSAFQSFTYGLKAVWMINASWLLDASIERYEMHGRDAATSPSVYPDAAIVTAGLRFSW